MKRIILVCLKDHFTSGSVNLITDLLNTKFKVDIHTENLSINQLESLISFNKENVFVLWQMEHLAPMLISKGIKVITFPMFDGCGVAPKAYFKLLDNTYLFNFSKKLHEICIASGVVSYPLIWFPETIQIEPNVKKQNKLFYWLRRPHESMNEAYITELFSPYINGIHIHNRPDFYDPKNSNKKVGNSFISVSDWFPEKADFLNLVTSHKFYLAPRASEGIGLAFLEAMSLGCIVFANRNSTHDQYIFDGYNGFLIDFESNDNELIKSQIKNAFKIIQSGKPIGENAKKFIQKGRPIWEKQSQKVLSTIETIANAKPLTPYSKTEQLLGIALVKLYRIHAKAYFKTATWITFLGYFSDKQLKIRLNILFPLFRKIIKKFS